VAQPSDLHDKDALIAALMARIEALVERNEALVAENAAPIGTEYQAVE